MPGGTSAFAILMEGFMAKKKMTPSQKRQAIWGWAFILPTMLGLIVLNYYPAINTVYQSLCKTGDFGKGNIFVGLNNYKAVLGSAEMWQSLWNTVKYAIVEVPLGIIIALVLAVLMQKKLAGKTLFRTLFFLPMVCAPAAVATVS